jgi:Xaa-Pro aminopeptidase
MKHPPRIPNAQRGAMEFTAPPVDLDALRAYRLGRLVEQIRAAGLGGMLLIDPINTRYATDSTNMQIWSMHDETRCVFIGPDGAVVLFDYDHLPHLVEDLPFITEVKVMPVFYYFAAGNHAPEAAGRFGGEIAAVLAKYGDPGLPLAVDRLSLLGIDALRERGLRLTDAWPLVEQARCIKSPEEIVLLRNAIAVAEAGCAAMREALAPGITENALWAKLHETNIRLGGEWIETRLLSSGPRTNPWFRECSMRVIERGDLVSFDTDLIGPYGYCADISRSWICGDVTPTEAQRTQYKHAHAQLEQNIAILKPGMSFRAAAEASWPIPEQYRSYRYSCLAHGVGLADEYPSLPYREDYARANALIYDGEIRENMVLSVESFIGTEGGKEGVKLEDQVLITGTGAVRLSSTPFEPALLR